MFQTMLRSDRLIEKTQISFTKILKRCKSTNNKSKSKKNINFNDHSLIILFSLSLSIIDDVIPNEIKQGTNKEKFQWLNSNVNEIFEK